MCKPCRKSITQDKSLSRKKPNWNNTHNPTSLIYPFKTALIQLVLLSTACRFHGQLYAECWLPKAKIIISNAVDLQVAFMCSITIWEDNNHFFSSSKISSFVSWKQNLAGIWLMIKWSLAQNLKWVYKENLNLNWVDYAEGSKRSIMELEWEPSKMHIPSPPDLQNNRLGCAL
jgi:hypothetical protein